VSLPVILRPAADAEISTTYHELEEIRIGLGQRFLASARVVFERIEDNPELYGLIWQDVRAARLKRFRHVVYYVVLDDRIEVLAVLHGSRDSGVWQSRV